MLQLGPLKDDGDMIFRGFNEFILFDIVFNSSLIYRIYYYDGDKNIYPWLIPHSLISTSLGLSPSIYSEAKVGGGPHGRKIYCISSHLLFCDRERSIKFFPISLIPKTFKAHPHYPSSDSILNPHQITAI